MENEMDYKEFKKGTETVGQKIVKLLKDKPRTVTFLAEHIDVSQPRISIVLGDLYRRGDVDRLKVKNHVYYGLIKK